MDKNFDFEDPDFLGFLQELLNSGILDEKEDLDKMCIGISKKAIDEGWDSLSEKQQNVLQIMCDKICDDRCTHCGDSIPWCEMMFAIEHKGMCTHCVHIWEDLQNE